MCGSFGESGWAGVPSPHSATASDQHHGSLDTHSGRADVYI